MQAAATYESTSFDDTCHLRWEGRYWTAAFDGTTVQLRDTPGLHCLAVLLAHPDIDISSLALERDALARRPGVTPPRRELHDSRERARSVVSGSIEAALDTVAAEHPALASHLRQTIRLGTLCRYAPGPQAVGPRGGTPPRWRSAG
jgi:hypothetical protein